MNFFKTIRNSLRASESDNPINEWGPAFKALAEDVDTKMASWWEVTKVSELPAAGQPNRLCRVTETGIIYQDTGSAWLALWPPFTFTSSTAAAGTLKAGEYARVAATLSGTWKLPAPVAGTLVGVFNAGGPSVFLHLTSVSGGFYGGPVNGASEITLTSQQNVLFLGEGANWYIIAGEPKPEQIYVHEHPLKAAAEAGITPSATRRALVTVINENLSEGCEIKVGGVSLGEIPKGSAITFRCNPGITWKANQNVGVATILE